MFLSTDPQQAQADQQADLMRQRLEEKRQQRAVPTETGDAAKEEAEMNRKKWSEPVGGAALARRSSITALVTEGMYTRYM